MKWLFVNLFTGSVKEHKEERNRRKADEKTCRHLVGILGVGLALSASYWIFGRWQCLCSASTLSTFLVAAGLSVVLVLTGWAFLRKAPIWCWIELTAMAFAVFAFSHAIAGAILGR
jgi:hypothetical protein